MTHVDAQGWWGRVGPSSGASLLPCPSSQHFLHIHGYVASANAHIQLSAMDVSVRSTMKGAAKCDKHCELQNSVNRQGLERILCFWDIPESMPASVSMLCCSSSCSLSRGMLLRSLVPQDAHSALLRYSVDKALLRQPAY